MSWFELDNAQMPEKRLTDDQVMEMVQKAYDGDFIGRIILPVKEGWRDVWGVDHVIVVKTAGEAQAVQGVAFCVEEWRRFMNDLHEMGVERMKAVIRAKVMFSGEIRETLAG